MKFAVRICTPPPADGRTLTNGGHTATRPLQAMHLTLRAVVYVWPHLQRPSTQPVRDDQNKFTCRLTHVLDPVIKHHLSIAQWHATFKPLG
jgi:hypothetical protein